jgi:hypothetical protein
MDWEPVVEASDGLPRQSNEDNEVLEDDLFWGFVPPVGHIGA